MKKPKFSNIPDLDRLVLVGHNGSGKTHITQPAPYHLEHKKNKGLVCNHKLTLYF